MKPPEMESLTIEREDGISTLYFDRPDKRNAMNITMFTELGVAAEFLRDDPDTRIVIMTGRGSAFSAGLDLSSMTEMSSADVGSFRTFVRVGQRNFRAFELIEKPVIAMVNGYALGAGTEISLACDMILASTEAEFGLLEVNYGLVTDLGATQRLPRVVGVHRAKDLIMTGRRIGAEEAERIGLVNAVYPPDRLEPETLALANQLKSLPATAVGLCKILIDRSRDGSIEAGLEIEAQAQSICFAEIVKRIEKDAETGGEG